MTQYNLYNDGQSHAGVHLIAVRTDSELDLADMELVGTVEAESTTEFNPAASSFQSNQAEYIQTGLKWPHDRAVVVR